MAHWTVADGKHPTEWTVCRATSAKKLKNVIGMTCKRLGWDTIVRVRMDRDTLQENLWETGSDIDLDDPNVYSVVMNGSIPVDIDDDIPYRTAFVEFRA